MTRPWKLKNVATPSLHAGASTGPTLGGVVAIVLAVAMGVETIPAKTEKTKWTTAREGIGGTETTIDVIEVSDAATVTGREIKHV